MGIYSEKDGGYFFILVNDKQKPLSVTIIHGQRFVYYLPLSVTITDKGLVNLYLCLCLSRTKVCVFYTFVCDCHGQRFGQSIPLSVTVTDKDW